MTTPCHPEAVIGTILAECPDTLPPNCAKLIEHAPESFDDLGHGIVAAAVRRLRDSGKPVGVLTVAGELNGELEKIGGELFLHTLSADAVSIDIAEYEAAGVLENYRKRKVRSVLGDALNALEAAPSQFDTIVAGTVSTLDSLSSDTPGDPSLPPIVDCSQFLATPLDPPEELVKGLLHKGSKLVLGGGSKSFKTWTLLDLALSVAHGRLWLGHETTPGQVLYANFEIQPWSWQGRLNAVAKARGIQIEPGRLSLINLRGKAADYSDLLPQLREAMGEDYSLIVLDPIYKLYGQTDENKAGDVARLLNAIEDLAVSTGAAVAFGAHFSKGNQASKESIDRISGSGVFARDPDSLLVFTKHEQEDAFTVEATLRNFAPLDPFVVRWQYPLMVPDSNLDPSRLKKAAGRKREYTPEDLLEVIGSDSLSSSEWQKEALSEKGVSSSSFYALLGELQKSGRVIKSRINRKWTAVSKA
jgi:hypothetical protein